MTRPACAYCLHAWKASSCQFSGSDWCRFEAQLEDQAHAINDSYNRVERKWEGDNCGGNGDHD